MNPGKLNKRATFKENTRVPDGAGGFIPSWTEKFTCWANMKTLAPQQREYLETNATFFLVWLIVRKDTARTPKAHMKVFIGTQEYNVLSVREYAQDNKYWEVEAKELAP